jgi:tetratricopeptide (TPR) repeat protein
MDDNLQELSELLLQGQKRSGQSSYRRRAPANAAAAYIRQARNGFHLIVEEQPGNAEAWRLLSQAEETLLSYQNARIALERVIALEPRPNRRDLKKLALLREYEAWWEGLGLTPEQLSELECYLEKALPASPCDHTMRHTKVWLHARGLLNADRIREALERRGGYCDCEVLHNVAR